MVSYARISFGIALAAVLACARPAGAQVDDNASVHHHTRAAPDSTHQHANPNAERKAASKRTTANSPSADHHAQVGTGHKQGTHSMAAMEEMNHEHMTTDALYGPYPRTREASGTAWQPDRARHEGIHEMSGAWMLMFHGMGDLVSTHQEGERGGNEVFASNMVMGMASRPLGPGRFGLRSMLSLEPATVGKEGYPLLLQTGETANGATRLIDRQHPHDFFMELAATYSASSGNRSLFLYGGLPGEPALGPPAFMHRFSGMSIPQAPITHHWLDSSHITFGVLTAGAVLGSAKFEASAFRGREPNQDRYDIESPKLDSHSFRFSLNPAPSWALQVSYGRLHSPEQLEPEVNLDRTTASAIYAADWRTGHWETTLAWGQNHNRPGPTLDAVALESAVQLRQRHTFMARAERVKKDELFAVGEPWEKRAFNVGELSAGYRFDFWRRGHLSAGLGALGTVSLVPRQIQGVYGSNPTSALIFGHLELR